MSQMLTTHFSDGEAGYKKIKKNQQPVGWAHISTATRGATPPSQRLVESKRPAVTGIDGLRLAKQAKGTKGQVGRQDLSEVYVVWRASYMASCIFFLKRCHRGHW